MATTKSYISKTILPKDKLLRIRVLEQAQDYEVNQTGLLCRVRERDSKGSLGLGMYVVIPEALRTAVVAGCHEGTEGHSSVIKTYQKVRDRIYWPGMFLDVQNVHKVLPTVQPQHRQKDEGANKAAHDGKRARGNSSDRPIALPKSERMQVSAGSRGCLLKVGGTQSP